MKKIFLALTLLSTILCSAKEIAQWIPPDKDMVGTGSFALANGINDWHIRITSDKLGGINPAGWRIRGGLWWSLVDIGKWYAPYDEAWSWNTLIKVVRSGNQTDLYFDPLLAWPGDIYTVTAVLGVDKKIEWKVLSNGEGWLSGAKWKGQSNLDQLGIKNKTGDGIRDWEINIENPFLESQISRVDVVLPYKPIGTRLVRSGCFDAWSTYSKGIRGSHTSPLSFDLSSGKMKVYINPILACGGDELFIRAIKPDGNWALWKVIGTGSDWETGGKWFGQEENDYISEFNSEPNGINDWHLRVESDNLSSPVRWIVRGAKTTWESAGSGLKLTDPGNCALYAIDHGSSADLYIEPAMERAGDIFYVSAVLADGTMLNWGITSTHQLRSNEIEWLGQDEDKIADISEKGITNKIAQWHIKVSHDKFNELQPYLWKISSNNKVWQTPEDVDLELRKTFPMSVEFEGRSASLFINPEWAKPGKQFDVEALFTDGTLVQWTTVADGAEWIQTGEWIDSAGADKAGHSKDGQSDGLPDWVIQISDNQSLDNLEKIEITGCGWRWNWPQSGSAYPIQVLPQGDSIILNIAPVPSKSSKNNLLTIKAITESGKLKFWKVIQPEE